jgi:hypothetical protein
MVQLLKLLPHDVLQDTQTSSGAPKSTPTWGNFKKALGISAGTAVGAAVVAMYINNFSNTSCIVTGTCSQINDVMKGVQLQRPCSLPSLPSRCTFAAPVKGSYCRCYWCGAHFR